jgi:hypothetical protein
MGGVTASVSGPVACSSMHIAKIEFCVYSHFVGFLFFLPNSLTQLTCKNFAFASAVQLHKQ